MSRNFVVVRPKKSTDKHVLTVISSKTLEERTSILRDTEARSVLRQIQDDGTSYTCSNSVAVSISNRQSGASVQSSMLDSDFAFDAVILSSGVYRNAFRKMLRTQRTLDPDPSVNDSSSSVSASTIQAATQEEGADNNELENGGALRYHPTTNTEQVSDSPAAQIESSNPKLHGNWEELEQDPLDVIASTRDSGDKTDEEAVDSTNSDQTIVNKQGRARFRRQHMNWTKTHLLDKDQSDKRKPIESVLLKNPDYDEDTGAWVPHAQFRRNHLDWTRVKPADDQSNRREVKQHTESETLVESVDQSQGHAEQLRLSTSIVLPLSGVKPREITILVLGEPDYRKITFVQAFEKHFHRDILPTNDVEEIRRAMREKLIDGVQAILQAISAQDFCLQDDHNGRYMGGILALAMFSKLNKRNPSAQLMAAVSRVRHDRKFREFITRSRDHLLNESVQL